LKPCRGSDASNVEMSEGLMRECSWLQWGHRGVRAGIIVCFLVTVWPLVARGDDSAPHRAARLSFLQGTVIVDHMDNTAGDPAQRNMPLVEDTRLNTGDDGQAEVEFEDGSVVRLTPNSSLTLNGLSVDAAGNFHTQMTLLHGLAYAELRASAKFTYSLEADGEAIWPVTNTTIRIGFDEPPMMLSVLDGTVHVERPSAPESEGHKTDVRAGETLTVDDADSSRYFLSQDIAPDSWDEWNVSRDQAAADAASSRTTARDSYAGDEGYGWSDLDANGSWYDVPGQGMVWQPTVAADAAFDPYGYGSWVAYPGTGYVWASGYPWGWTPFRCGNWSYWNGFGWGWAPVGGCGLAGWGFGGGAGYVINVVRPPLHYHSPTRPIQAPGGILHPVAVGRAVPEPPVGATQTPKTIAGATVQPLRPVDAGTSALARSGNPVGGALRSDYAIDKTSHRPVVGLAPGSSVKPLPGQMPSGQRSVYPAQESGEHGAPRYSSPSYTPRPTAPAPPPAPRAPAAPPSPPAAPKK
jgi:hypothetical protein